MSNTYKHKGAGKFKNTDTPINKIHKSTLLMWDRHNSDFGEDKERQLQIKDKILDKEMKEEIRVIEMNEHIDFDIIEQEEIINKFNTQCFK